MALSIVSNQAASIATRQLEQSNNAATATAEKLSSGKRINSAKDDAAASAIAARLSAEVAGLQQASVNAGQASSLLQIADGAYQNVEDILTRAKSLAVQAGSEQISDSERAFLDQEFSALKSEIDRIANDTEFNGTKLVSGGVEAAITDSANYVFGTNDGVDVTASVDGANVTGIGGLQGIDVMGVKFAEGATMNVVTADSKIFGQVASFTFVTASSPGAAMFTLNVQAQSTGGNSVAAAYQGTISTEQLTGSNSNMIPGDIKVTLMAAGGMTDGTVTVRLGSAFNPTTSGVNATNEVALVGNEQTGFDFKVGTGTTATEDEISVDIGGITTNALGLSGASIDTKAAADNASEAVSTAIDSLQAKRSEVGAAQNRLDFASQNVELTRENQEAARSELEDLNVAKAITEFSQQQLLVQAGTSTLSQANSLPQNLLQLFR